MIMLRQERIYDWESFDNHAKLVIKRADYLARERGADYQVKSEYLVGGLLFDDLYPLLAGLRDLSGGVVLNNIEMTVQQVDITEPPSFARFTEDALGIIDEAIKEAKLMNLPVVDSHCLLAGLVVKNALGDLGEGVDLTMMRAERLSQLYREQDIG